ncbi:MAG: C13 family peptidase, partial [Thermoplasmatota archaeon]
MHRRLVICIFILLLIGICTETGRSEQRQTWALCFDVNPLGYALGDAFERALLDGGWRNSHVNVVTTNSRPAFLHGMHWLQSVAHSEDTVIFYFSGHGYTGGMGIGSEAVSYASLDDEFDKVACRGMFIILDSCHSGSAIPLLEESGRVILTSCGSGEISGYFSEAVISALSVAADCNGNNDGSVSAEEIASYVMSDWHIEQYRPQVEDGYQGNMSLLTTLWGDRAAEVFQVYGQQTMQMFTDDRWLRQSFI